MPDFGAIISATFNAIKKNKWLFVYALVIAAFSSGGNYSSFSNSFSSSESTNLENLPQELPEKTSTVLGAYTGAVAEWFSSIQVSLWLFLVLALLLAFFLSLIIRVVASSWARSGIILGFNKAFLGELVSLKNTSKSAVSYIKNIIFFDVYMFLVVFLVILAFGVIWLIGYLTLRSVGDFGILISVVGIFLTVATLIYVFILFSFISAYGERLIVLKNLTPKLAWKKAFSLSRGNFFPSLIMSVINSLLGTGVGCLSMVVMLLVLGVPSFVMLYPSITSGKVPSPLAIVFLLLIFFVFIYLSYAVQAVITLFRYGNWNQMFYFVLEKEEKRKNGK